MNHLKFIPEYLHNGVQILRLVIPDKSDALENLCMDDASHDDYPIPDLDITVPVNILAQALKLAREHAFVKSITIPVTVRSQVLDAELDGASLSIFVSPECWSLILDVYNCMSGIRYFMYLDNYFSVQKISDLPCYLEGLMAADALSSPAAVLRPELTTSQGKMGVQHEPC